jgi:hypothetical protein
MGRRRRINRRRERGDKKLRHRIRIREKCIFRHRKCKKYRVKN